MIIEKKLFVTLREKVIETCNFYQTFILAIIKCTIIFKQFCLFLNYLWSFEIQELEVQNIFLYIYFFRCTSERKYRETLNFHQIIPLVIRYTCINLILLKILFERNDKFLSKSINLYAHIISCTQESNNEYLLTQGSCSSIITCISTFFYSSLEFHVNFLQNQIPTNHRSI